MTDINRELVTCAEAGDLDAVTRLLELGADVNAKGRFGLNSALEYSVWNNHLDIVTKLLEYNADVHVHSDSPLQLSMSYRRIKIMEKLLENGANIHCNNRQLLKRLRTNFDEEMADAMLPYCDISDYKYFPLDYIKKRIIPTKNANSSSSTNLMSSTNSCNSTQCSDYV